MHFDCRIPPSGVPSSKESPVTLVLAGEHRGRGVLILFRAAFNNMDDSRHDFMSRYLCLILCFENARIISNLPCTGLIYVYHVLWWVLGRYHQFPSPWWMGALESLVLTTEVAYIPSWYQCGHERNSGSCVQANRSSAFILTNFLGNSVPLSERLVK